MGNHIAAPIEKYHGDANTDFHEMEQFSPNVTIVDGIRFLNGIAVNNIIAKFKTRIMKTYRISSDAIPSTSKIKSDNDRRIIEHEFYEMMSKEPKCLSVTSPFTYKKLKKEIESLNQKINELEKELKNAKGTN